MVMNVLFYDVHLEIGRHLSNLHRGKLDGTPYSEILYADDTLVFGKHTPSINKYLREIQKETLDLSASQGFLSFFPSMEKLP